jgi:hypothetical protein
MNAYRTIGFALVMLLYLAYPYYLIHQQEQILEEGVVFSLPLQPVDPIDAFRGRYLSLNYEAPTLPAPQGLESGQTIYVTLRRDSLGYAYFDQVFLEAPQGQPYIETTGYPVNGEVSVDIPENLWRYYLNEKLAPAAEEAYFELVQSGDRREIRAYAQVRVLNGEVRIEEVFLEGEPLRAYLRGD